MRRAGARGSTAREARDEDHLDRDAGISLAADQADHQRQAHLHPCRLRAGEDRAPMQGITGIGLGHGGAIERAIIDAVRRDAGRRGPDRCRAALAQDVGAEAGRPPRPDHARDLGDRHRPVGHPRPRRPNMPLWKMLGGFRDRVPTYVAGGYYEEGKGLRELGAGDGRQRPHGRAGGQDEGGRRADRRGRRARPRGARRGRARGEAAGRRQLRLSRLRGDPASPAGSSRTTCSGSRSR